MRQGRMIHRQPRSSTARAGRAPVRGGEVLVTEGRAHTAEVQGAEGYRGATRRVI